MKGLNQILDLLTEIRDRLWKDNATERIKQLEWQVNLLQGNGKDMLKRQEALEGYLKVEYKKEEKYVSK